MGLTALPALLALNLFALFILNQPAAVFFSDQWWPTWFTNYGAWGVYLVFGLAQLKKKPNQAVDQTPKS